MKRLIINLAVFGLTFAIGATLHALRPIDQRVSRQAREAESYAVYSAVIKDNGDKMLVLIYDKTNSWPPYREPPDEAKIVRRAFPRAKMPEILRDYGIENLARHALISNFALNSHYALVSDSEHYFESAENFFRQFPNSRGIIGLSAVGFDSQMDHALVYARTYCAGECGGAFYLLTKENGVWNIAEWQLG